MDIFISYRRDDSSGYAGRLYDQMSEHFGPKHVFMDVAAIEAGSDFANVIEEKIATCDALIAIIGRGWLTCKDDQGRLRLQLSDDFVSLEIAAALKRSVEVIPVLVGGATMPRQRDLPPQLQPLARHQAVEISDPHFTRDVADLVEDMETPGGKRKSGLPKNLWLAVSVVVCLLAVAIGLWNWRHLARSSPPDTQSQAPSPASPPPASSDSAEAANISGNWRGVVTKGNVTFEVYFTFEVVGDKLFGKVIYPTGDAGILDGTIRHGEISFLTRHVPQFSSEEATTTIEGRVKGSEIDFVLQAGDGFGKGVAQRVTQTASPKVLSH